jgi:hypothetical protein
MNTGYIHSMIVAGKGALSWDVSCAALLNNVNWLNYFHSVSSNCLQGKTWTRLDWKSLTYEKITNSTNNRICRKIQSEQISGSNSGKYEYCHLGYDTLWSSRSSQMLCRNILTVSSELMSKPSKYPGRSIQDIVLFPWLTLWPRTWKQHIPPKCWRNSTVIHGNISRMTIYS